MRHPYWLLVILALALGGCASQPQVAPSGPPVAASAADRAAAHAAKMVGKPYRYGGASPASGFDCSGLVQYSYKQAGAFVPRTTDDQRRRSRPIRRAELRRGDLLFFDQEGRKNSHVGIYLGANRFVHAPSSGKRVRSDRLDGAYWRKHLSEIRRP
jgi:murein DD-endopeptidase